MPSSRTGITSAPAQRASFPALAPSLTSNHAGRTAANGICLSLRPARAHSILYDGRPVPGHGEGSSCFIGRLAEASLRCKRRSARSRRSEGGARHRHRRLYTPRIRSRYWANTPRPASAEAWMKQIYLEHREGIEPSNTGFADQPVSHLAIGASLRRATRTSARDGDINCGTT